LPVFLIETKFLAAATSTGRSEIRAIYATRQSLFESRKGKGLSLSWSKKKRERVCVCVCYGDCLACYDTEAVCESRMKNKKRIKKEGVKVAVYVGLIIVYGAMKVWISFSGLNL
jgi:hypothetical protein